MSRVSRAAALQAKRRHGARVKLEHDLLTEEQSASLDLLQNRRVDLVDVALRRQPHIAAPAVLRPRSEVKNERRDRHLRAGRRAQPAAISGPRLDRHGGPRPVEPERGIVCRLVRRPSLNGERGQPGEEVARRGVIDVQPLGRDEPPLEPLAANEFGRRLSAGDLQFERAPAIKALKQGRTAKHGRVRRQFFDNAAGNEHDRRLGGGLCVDGVRPVLRRVANSNRRCRRTLELHGHRQPRLVEAVLREFGCVLAHEPAGRNGQRADPLEQRNGHDARAAAHGALKTPLLGIVRTTPHGQRRPPAPIDERHRPHTSAAELDDPPAAEELHLLLERLAQHAGLHQEDRPPGVALHVPPLLLAFRTGAEPDRVSFRSIGRAEFERHLRLVEPIPGEIGWCVVNVRVGAVSAESAQKFEHFGGHTVVRPRGHGRRHAPHRTGLREFDGAFFAVRVNGDCDAPAMGGPEGDDLVGGLREDERRLPKRGRRLIDLRAQRILHDQHLCAAADSCVPVRHGLVAPAAQFARVEVDVFRAAVARDLGDLRPERDGVRLAPGRGRGDAIPRPGQLVIGELLRRVAAGGLQGSEQFEYLADLRVRRDRAGGLRHHPLVLADPFDQEGLLPGTGADNLDHRDLRRVEPGEQRFFLEGQHVVSRRSFIQ